MESTFFREMFSVFSLNYYHDISKTLTGLITALAAPVLILFAIPICERASPAL
ncbi:MAG: hypothetical protein JEZ04_00500 [Spirochaetales bacterium]|nr:hypothetical protein [Spirochaetales bacterium]